MSSLRPFRAAEDEEIDDEEEDKDDLDEEGEDEDEDDKVGTDENGNETLKAREMSASGRTDVEPPPAPDVNTDRDASAQDAEVGGSSEPVRKPPLGIAEIEELEDDAKGG